MRTKRVIFEEKEIKYLPQSNISKEKRTLVFILWALSFLAYVVFCTAFCIFVHHKTGNIYITMMVVSVLIIISSCAALCFIDDDMRQSLENL